MKPILIHSLGLGLGLLCLACSSAPVPEAPAFGDTYDICWTSQSAHSGESMPCGGGDIGLNVWAEDGDLLIYLGRSACFDDNNCLLKLGRLRLRTDFPLQSDFFLQVLHLADGSVRVQSGVDDAALVYRVWVDVFKPVIHIEMESARPRPLTVWYESWRTEDHLLARTECNANSYKWAPPKGLTTKADHIGYQGDKVYFRHQNPAKETMFDVVCRQQDMEAYAANMYNPLANRTFGGCLSGKGFKAAGVSEGVYQSTPYRAWSLESSGNSLHHELQVVMATVQPEASCDSAQVTAAWKRELAKTERRVDTRRDHLANRQWWSDFWQRSYIIIDESHPGSEAWKVGRQYQLFRYMLACNAYGEYPTKFNGGLFTFDPVHVMADRDYTPDFRNWGGGTHTAQNQRLVYFPLLKSGDFDLMTPQFEFYRRILYNAECRSLRYWGHEGACFTEQMENFGLPNPSEYAWKRPADSDKGVEYNKWLEYLWDTSLEFCQMILECGRYGGGDVSAYYPLVESCLTFFDEHYRYEAARVGKPALNENGKLDIYPGSGCETYKLALNPASTVAGLRVLTESYLRQDLSPEKRERWTRFLETLPELPMREWEGRTLLAPAESWDRLNNTEAPQLYPVWPWRIANLLSPLWQPAVDTYFHDPDVQKFYSHVGWKQYAIFAACLGLKEEARDLCLKKFAPGPHRFPAFWGPGFDWTPDHNWGGSASIALQEMLLQEIDGRLLVCPAWPTDWDVRFKLWAPGRTRVEACVKEGKLEYVRTEGPEAEAYQPMDCLNGIQN